jgi:hypothetical protein
MSRNYLRSTLSTTTSFLFIAPLIYTKYSLINSLSQVLGLYGESSFGQIGWEWTWNTWEYQGCN